jgi:hypothetical protein
MAQPLVPQFLLPEFHNSRFSQNCTCSTDTTRLGRITLFSPTYEATVEEGTQANNRMRDMIMMMSGAILSSQVCLV